MLCNWTRRVSRWALVRPTNDATMQHAACLRADERFHLVGPVQQAALARGRAARADHRRARLPLPVVKHLRTGAHEARFL